MDKDCGAWINLLSHRLKARLDASFQDLGITGVQSRVIFYILAHCGEGPVFQRDIENVFALSRSTATGILQVLEKNGMIRRERVAADARLKSLVPTQRAAELNAQVRDCLREADRMLTRGISEGQLQLFRETAALMLRKPERMGKRLLRGSGRSGAGTGGRGKFAAEQTSHALPRRFAHGVRQQPGTEGGNNSMLKVLARRRPRV